MVRRRIFKLLTFLLIVFQIMINTVAFAQEESEVPTGGEQQTSHEIPAKDEEKEKEEPTGTYVKVTGLDVADYQKEMEVGDKQLLMVTVLPLEATDRKVYYSSSKEEVATVNELGRITALKPGTAKITIQAADGVKEQLTIKVNKVKSSYVSVQELDLGEYNEEMRVGEKQLLSVSVLPANATDYEIRYASSNEKVASINGYGRITALSEGETVITVTAGGEENSFVLKVLPKKDTKVKEIDLGDYRSEMEVGETQVIMPEVLPVDAVNPGFTYKSANTNVATINGLGRIRANSAGTTVITVECDGIKKEFTLKVNEKKNIKVEELDLGEYRNKMKVGEKQLISPSVLPAEASGREITYNSDNTSVATINAFGRITALSVGETKITASVDGISKSFDLKVEENDEYPVEDIDIGKYEEEMETGKTQKLTVTVLPSNAKDSEVKYTSSNPEIASIDSSGEIKALEKGSTVITIKAGDVKKEVKIKVVARTEKLETNKSYLVLKAGEQFKLECKVLPKEANQKIDYKSTNPSVAKVDNKGLITALNTGKATIIASNGYGHSLVTVIVNKELMVVDDAVIPAAGNAYEEDLVLKLLKESDSTAIVNKNELLLVSRPVLKYLYESKGKLVVDGDRYNITIDGKDIENYENELLTEIVCEEEDKGIGVILNDNHNLPGNISITFNDVRVQNAKYLYLYNEAKKKYEMIGNALENGTMKVDVAGKYLLTEKKLSFLSVNILLIAAACFCLLVVTAAYIFTKKKYWFW